MKLRAWVSWNRVVLEIEDSTEAYGSAITHHYDYDLIIIGGGPVGMALALALRGSGISVLLLEARGLPAKTEDSRPLALSHGSRLILQRLGVWKAYPKSLPSRPFIYPIAVVLAEPY